MNQNIACLVDLLGFSQTQDPCIPLIDPQLTEPILKYESENPFVNHKELYESLIDTSALVWQQWDAVLPYTAGQRVAYNGHVYVAKLDSVGELPTNVTFWDILYAVPNYSLELEKARLASVQRAHADVMNLNFSKFNKRALISNGQIIANGGYSNTLAPLSDGQDFVFLAILPSDRNTLLKVNSLTLYFNQTFELPIYFYDSHNFLALDSIVLSTLALSQKKHIIDFSFSPSENSYLIIGYYKADVPFGAMPISKKVVSANSCNSCGKMSSDNKFLSFKFGALPLSALNGGDLPDMSDAKYASLTTGIDNIGYSLYCDYTDFICQNRELWISVLSKKFAIDSLERILLNPNGRANQTVTPDRTQRIVYALEGNDGKGGLRSEYTKAVQSFNFNFSGFGGACFPCLHSSMTYGSF